MGNVYERVFGIQVRELRQARGWTQDQFANALAALGFPIHQTTVAKMEGGTRPTSVGEIAAIAKLFDVPIGTLFERPGDMATHLHLATLKIAIESIEREQAQLRERLAELDEEHEKAEAEYQEYQDLSHRLTEGG